MRDPYQLVFDAKYGSDIERLRYEFKPDLGGSRDNENRLITVSSAQSVSKVGLWIRASDLYLIGFKNEHGDFYLSDATSVPEHDTSIVLSYSSHYQSLGTWAGRDQIDIGEVNSAVVALSLAPHREQANRLRVSVGMMALVVPESLRQGTIAGQFESLFAGRFTRLSRQQLKQTVNNYSKSIKQGNPYVELLLK